MDNFSQTFLPFEFDGAKSSATNNIYVYMHALYTTLSLSRSLSLSLSLSNKAFQENNCSYCVKDIKTKFDSFAHMYNDCDRPGVSQEATP